MSNLFYFIKHLLLFLACLTYLIYSLFVRFINFCHLINLSSSYQSFVIYSLFTLSSHPINAPTVHITHTTLFPVLSCARSLRQYNFLTHQASLAIVPLWLWGDRGLAGGFLIEHTDLFQELKWLVVNLKERTALWPKTNNGDENLYWKNRALGVILRDAPTCARIRLWPLRRDDSLRVLIGTTGMWRSDWHRRDVGALIGQSAWRH